MSDVRSGIQVASGEGNASKMNFSLGGWGWGGLGWATAGGYSKTPEGKLIAASLLDNYNKVVVAIRSKPHLIRTRSEASIANAAMSTQATPQTAVLAAPAALAPGGAMIVAPRLAATTTVVLPKVVAVAQPTVILQLDNVLPAPMIGAFTGQFGGAHTGVLSLLIAASGRINGVIQSAAAGGSIPVSGIVNANGSLVMMGSNQGTTVQFSGLIDGKSGALIGTWMVVGQNLQGTFNGRRE